MCVVHVYYEMWEVYNDVHNCTASDYCYEIVSKVSIICKVKYLKLNRLLDICMLKYSYMCINYKQTNTSNPVMFTLVVGGRGTPTTPTTVPTPPENTDKSPSTPRGPQGSSTDHGYMQFDGIST